MNIETYSDKYQKDVEALIDNFYLEAIHYHNTGLDKDVLARTVMTIGTAQGGNAYLLIVNDRCEGILAGIEIPNMINKKRIFQELIWYINEPFRRYGVALLKRVQESIKAQGFEMMIMGVLENCKTEKIKRLYERMGFALFESQYIRSL